MGMLLIGSYLLPDVLCVTKLGEVCPLTALVPDYGLDAYVKRLKKEVNLFSSPGNRANAAT
jgi:hypothetical protein